MKTFILGMSAAEVVHLLRAETTAALGAPELNTVAEKDYVIEEDFDRRTYQIHDVEQYDLVTSIATLAIEPRVESGYWILEAVVERFLGLVRTSEQDELTRCELTLDEFEAELRSPGPKRVIVRLSVQTPDVRRDFDRWIEGMRARYPWKAEPDLDQVSIADVTTRAASWTYAAREAVGVFGSPDALEAAVDELEASGFDRAAISVLATGTEAKHYVDRFYRTVGEIEDSGGVPRQAFVSSDSQTEAEAAAVGIPLYIGGFAGAAAVAASGGALALAIAATVAGSAVGAGLGALLAVAIAHHHTVHVREQLKKGGLVLWVSAPQPDAAERATAVLKRMGARDVHVHKINREWSLGDAPLAGLAAWPDPLLERDGRARKALPESHRMPG